MFINKTETACLKMKLMGRSLVNPRDSQLFSKLDSKISPELILNE